MSRPYRYDKQAKHNVVYGRDITIGYATLKHALRKGVAGWDLPGFGFTDNGDDAERIALNMHNLIADMGGLPRDWMTRRVLPAVTTLEVTA